MPRTAEGRDMPPSFLRPRLGSFCRLDEIGLQVMGQRLEPGRAVLACLVIETDETGSNTGSLTIDSPAGGKQVSTGPTRRS
jgi:hypothetical protein